MPKKLGINLTDFSGSEPILTVSNQGDRQFAKSHFHPGSYFQIFVHHRSSVDLWKLQSSSTVHGEPGCFSVGDSNSS